MDIKMLDGNSGLSELSVQSLQNMANRQKRREFFYRSALRAVLLTLLFIAFGCLFAIYRQECGNPLSLYRARAETFNLRSVLKEFFFVSVVPASCFSVCFSFGGRFCRVCDTLFPAIYGTYAGALLYGKITEILSAYSVNASIRALPFLLFVVSVIFAYTLLCSVCTSYGECRKNGGAVQSDTNSCFTYFLICETALLLLILLRECALALLNIFS